RRVGFEIRAVQLQRTICAGGLGLPQNNLRGVEIRHRSETEGDEIGKLRESNHDYRLHDLLIAETIRAQRVDVLAAHLLRLTVQFESEVEQRLQNDRKVRGCVVKGDLFWIRSRNAQH